MRAFLPLFLLTACAPTPMRGKVIAVEFGPGTFRHMHAHALAEMDRAEDACALHPGQCEFGSGAGPHMWTQALGSCAHEVPEAGGEWDRALLAVRLEADFARGSMAISALDDDPTNVDRVVAWLEACGGKRVPGAR